MRIARFGARNFFRTVAAIQLVEFVLRVFFLRDGHFPIGFGGIALLFGNQIFLRERFVALKVKPRPRFVRSSAIDVGLRRCDVFFAVAVLPHVGIGFGLLCGGTRFGDFFGTVATFCFFRRSAGLRQRGKKFLIVESHQNLSSFDGVAFAHQQFIDAAANFGTHANVARFHCAGTL